MPIDFSKYNSDKITPTKWEPPVPERTMKYNSAKLALSTRSYPEYLMAAYALLESQYNKQASSLSELLHLVLCDYLNQNMQEIGAIPSPDVSLDFLIKQGWISADNKENQAPLSKIRKMSTEAEARALEGDENLATQYNYWKDRDPEKAESIMQQIVEGASEELSKPITEEERSEAGVKSDPSQGIDLDPSQGFYEPPTPKKPKTEDRELTKEELQQQAEARDRAEQEKMKAFLEDLKQEGKEEQNN